jgi:hypothetical protein
MLTPSTRLDSQKMADSNHPTSNPPAQTANPQRVLPDGAGRPVPLGDREFAGGGEGNCPLWYGNVIDATFPLVNVPRCPPCVHPVSLP